MSSGASSKGTGWAARAILRRDYGLRTTDFGLGGLTTFAKATVVRQSFSDGGSPALLPTACCLLPAASPIRACSRAA